MQWVVYLSSRNSSSFWLSFIESFLDLWLHVHANAANLWWPLLIRIRGCGQLIPCGKVRGNTMKTRGLPRITHAFPRVVSADTVKKFYAATLHDTLRRYVGVQYTVINSWRRWLAKVVRERCLVPPNRVVRCVLRYQLVLYNSTRRFPAHSSLIISPSFSAIHTSSGKLLQCSDDVRYSRSHSKKFEASS